MNKQEAIKKTQTTFNAASDYFDAPALSFWNRFGQRTIDRLSLQPGDRLLDVCCGSGASAIPAGVYVGSTGEVLGIDIAESLLKLGREKSRQQDLENIEFRYGDFENLGFPEESFDVIVCVFGIFFVPDMVAAVRELWRMVRPGGKLAVTSWGENLFEPAHQFFWDTVEAECPDLRQKFTPWERIGNPASLQALLESSGAKKVEVWAEANTHQLTAPEDWWTIVLGSGFRNTIEQLNPIARERVRQANLQLLRTNEVRSLKVDVLYAIAQK